MDNYFDVPREAAGAVSAASTIGEAIQLPFFAPVFWWVRGDSTVQPDVGSGVRHFGGWATDATALEAEGLEIPPYLMQEYFTSDDGKSYAVYACRTLAVAQIGIRFRWTIRRNPDGSVDARDKGRGHVHILCHSATYDKKAKTYTPWSPVVLSAKGLSARSLQDAFQTWSRSSAVPRAKMTSNAMANFFWCHVGTFGKEAQHEKVGKKGQQSYISPVQVYIPEDINEEYLKRTFVGREMAEKMGSLAEEAKEWLHAWDDQRGKGRDDGTSPEPEYDAPPEPVDIPF